MCFCLESDGKIDQSRFDFKWAGQKLKIVGLHEVQTAGRVVRAVRAVRDSKMAEDKSNVVASLIASPFSRRPFAEKLQIIKNGRPTPELELKEKVKKVERHFKTENYQRYQWMTGCEAHQDARQKQYWT